MWKSRGVVVANRWGRESPVEFNFGWDGKRPMNINYWWLEYIKDQIGIFMHYRQNLEKIYDDITCMTMMFEALEMLEALTSPKMDNDEVERNLEWLQNNIPAAYSRSNEGEIMAYNPWLCFVIRRRLLNVFRLSLIKLEKNGLLTIAVTKPTDAMGKFSSA